MRLITPNSTWQRETAAGSNDATDLVAYRVPCADRRAPETKDIISAVIVANRSSALRPACRPVSARRTERSPLGTPLGAPLSGRPGTKIPRARFTAQSVRQAGE